MPKVLIVDDDESSRLALVDALEGEGFDILEAAGGQEALGAVAAHSPDLILLDIMMPDTDGVEVCRALKQAEETHHIPVIMVTALGHEEDVARGLNAGATDYVGKPFSGEVVRARVRTALTSKLARDELVQLASQVSAKNRKLAEFADTAQRLMDDVSHDFRTPLSVIQELALIVADGLDGPTTAKQREHLGIITVAVGDISRMVDDFLDSSRLRVGSLRVDRRAHRVEDILHPAMAIIGNKARRRAIDLQESIAPGLPMVFADRDKAERVVVNLAVNAIKFSPNGREVRLWAKLGQAGNVEIGVTDHGRGISPGQLRVVFDRFTQAGNAAEAAQGLGLGLSIAKDLAGLNLGVLQATSELGQGSTFWFTLPTTEPEVILEKYFEQLGRSGGGADQLAVLRVSTDDPIVAREYLYLFLTATCYPMDLVLDSSDGRSLLAVGLTAELDPWVQRLHSAWAQMVSDDASDQKAEIRIQLLGSWSYRQQRDSAQSFLLGLLQRSPCNACKSSDHR